MTPRVAPVDDIVLGKFLPVRGLSCPNLPLSCSGAWKSAAQIRRDVLDVVAAAEIYAEKGHDDVAVAVRARPFPPFPEGRIDQFGQADALENIHDVKNSSKRGHVLRFYC